jgi:hypothetical protein
MCCTRKNNKIASRSSCYPYGLDATFCELKLAGVTGERHGDMHPCHCCVERGGSVDFSVCERGLR